MIAEATRSGEQAEGSTLVKFDFHGDELEVIQHDGEHYVVLARLCDALGVGTDTQADKLKKVAWGGYRIIRHPDFFGVLQDYGCIPLRAIPMWLATIHTSKVRPELRDRLGLYQRECADVLADHFIGRRRNDSAVQSTLKAMADRFDAMERRLESAEQTRGVLSDWQVVRIKRDVHELALARVELGWNPSVTSATTWIQNRIAAWSNFGGTGASRENMSDERYERVLVCLAQIEKDIQDECSRRGEGRRQVRTLKRALQRDLFDPRPAGK